MMMLARLSYARLARRTRWLWCVICPFLVALPAAEGQLVLEAPGHSATANASPASDLADDLGDAGQENLFPEFQATLNGPAVGLPASKTPSLESVRGNEPVRTAQLPQFDSSPTFSSPLEDELESAVGSGVDTTPTFSSPLDEPEINAPSSAPTATSSPSMSPFLLPPGSTNTAQPREASDPQPAPSLLSTPQPKLRSEPTFEPKSIAKDRSPKPGSGNGSAFDKMLTPNPTATTSPLTATPPAAPKSLQPIADDKPGPTLGPTPDQLMAGNLKGWWEPMIAQGLRGASQPSEVSVGNLVYSALQHSARVKVFSDTPLIRETAVIESDANFDWGLFLETAWNDVNDPVGSTLITGFNGPSRFQNEKFTHDFGFKKKNRLGGDFSVGQQYGWEQSNSQFFLPNNQGSGRLTLNYTQPLMRGRGRMYNTSTVVLAQIGAGAARDEFSRELQTYLQEVTEAYWTLYLERGTLLQRQRLHKRGAAILDRLEVRKELDAISNQIVRAKSAVASRKSSLFRAAASVKNAEGQLRALVNGPELGVLDEFELLPIDPPANMEINVTMHDAIEAAVRNRPELHQAMKEISAASTRLNVSRNELLPALDFVINTYVSGLRGDASIGKAFTDQFNTGSPSYSTGLKFEYPLGNRAARARNKRRLMELRQLQHQFRNTLNLLQLETETALRETQTTFREVEAKHQAMEAAKGEVELLTDRWKTLPGDDRSASLLLEDLLAAQERLAAQEFGFLKAQVDYSISLVNLKRATGTLLQFENVSVSRSEVDGVPELHLNRGAAPVSYGTPVSSAPPMMQGSPVISDADMPGVTIESPMMGPVVQ